MLCDWCGEPFTPPRWRKNPRMCSRACTREYARTKTRKLPRVQIVSRMYTIGNMSLREIAAQFGVTPQAVWLLLKRNGVELREYTRKKVA